MDIMKVWSIYELGRAGSANMTAGEAGDPIHAGTGNVHHAELDYSAPSGLEFSRSYNSGIPGWVHSYMQRVIFDDTRADLIRPDGKIFSFTGSGLGVWTTNPTIVGQLTKIDPATHSGAQWQYVNDSESIELYDENGMPMSMTERNGKVWTFVASGKLLQTVTDPWGRSLSFTYDTDNRIASVTVPGNHQITYQYDTQGRLGSVTYPDTKTRQYVFEDTAQPLLLTGVIDESNTRFVTWGYDTQGRGTSTSQAGGSLSAQFVYGTNSTQVTDAIGTARTVQFTGVSGKQLFSGGSQPCANCVGDAAAQIIDATTGLITQSTDHRGIVRQVSWDNTRLLPTSQTRAAGRPEAQTTETQWHPNYRLPSLVIEKDAGGTPLRSTAYTYDTSGRLQQQTTTEHASSRTRTVQWSYNTQGLVHTMTDPRNNVWTYGYDTQGNLTTVTNPLSQTTTYGYDASGRLTSITDPNGMVVTNVYDVRQRLQSSTAAGQTTSYTYHPTGRLQRITFADGAWLDYEYDGAQRLKAIADKLGNRIEYTMNGLGNRTVEAVKDTGGVLRRQIQRSYNTLGQLQQKTGEF